MNRFKNESILKLVYNDNISTESYKYIVMNLTGEAIINRKNIIFNLTDFSQTIILEKDTSYTDTIPSAYYRENSVNIDVSVSEYTNNLDISTVGNYQIVYKAEIDSNFSYITRDISVIDTIVPIITLSGLNEIYIKKDTSFIEPGYLATDFFNIDLSNRVIVTSNVNTAIIGRYTVSYNLFDDVSNSAEAKIRYVNVFDISYNLTDFSQNYTHEKGYIYTDVRPRAYSMYNPNTLSNELYVIESSNNLNPNILGNYQIVYKATVYNVVKYLIRDISVIDTIIPVITLLGSTSITLNRGSAFVDPGFSASDFFNIDLTSSVIVNTGGLNTSLSDTSYIITYDVSDGNGNQAIQKQRIISIILSRPIITLSGSSVTVNRGFSYNEPGYSAIDYYGTDITSSVVINSATLNTSISGNYIITYNVTDINGNAAIEKTRTINVIQVNPTITVIGNVLSVYIGSNYYDVSVSAIDYYGNNLYISTNGTVNTNILGDYILTYTASDIGGNTSTAIRTVSVIQHMIKTISVKSVVVRRASKLEIQIDNSDVTLDSGVHSPFYAEWEGSGGPNNGNVYVSFKSDLTVNNYIVTTIERINDVLVDNWLNNLTNEDVIIVGGTKGPLTNYNHLADGSTSQNLRNILGLSIQGSNFPENATYAFIVNRMTTPYSIQEVGPLGGGDGGGTAFVQMQVTIT